MKKYVQNDSGLNVAALTSECARNSYNRSAGKKSIRNEEGLNLLDSSIVDLYWETVIYMNQGVWLPQRYRTMGDKLARLTNRLK